MSVTKNTTRCIADENYTVTLISVFPAEIIENYEYHDYSYNQQSESEVPQIADEWLDASANNKKALNNNLNLGEIVTYQVCVRLVNIHIFFGDNELAGKTKNKTYLCISQPIYFLLFLCSHSLDRNLTGMAIADITLLSGFEVEIEDMEKVSGSLSLSLCLFFILLSTRRKELIRVPHAMKR